MNNDIERKISSNLFGKIKPVCVKLVEGGNENLLIELKEILIKDKEESFGYYSISPNVGDYIFYPISTILNQELATRNLNSPHDFSTSKSNARVAMIQIVDYLIVNSWVPHNRFKELIGHLLPVILYLIKQVGECQQASDLLYTIIVYEDFYTEDIKKLTMLSEIIQILLKDVGMNIKGLKKIMDSISDEQLSRVFPGIVSAVVNYYQRNTTYEVTCELLDILRMAIIKVFNDEALGLKLTSKDLNHLDDGDVGFTLDSGDFRNESWLKATSTQLKLSLVSLFKKMFSRKIIKTQVFDSVLKFTRDLLYHCYWSLFDILSVHLDNLSLVNYCRFYPDTGKLPMEVQKELLSEIPFFVHLKDDSKTTTFVRNKLNDLIDKAPLIMNSFDEERILKYFISLKTHLSIIHDDDIILNVLQAIKKALSVSNENESLHNLNDLLRNTQNPTGIAQNPTDEVDEDIINPEDNKLDDIKLPPYVNASNIKKFQYRDTTSKQLTLTNWTMKSEETRIIPDIHKSVELELTEFVVFLNDLINDKVSLLNNFIDDEMSLWIANNLFNEIFDINEFLDFGDQTNDEDDEEIAYLLGNQCQDIIESVELDKLTTITTRASETISNNKEIQKMGIAIDTMGKLSNILPKDEFKENFLINYLYSLFESLTVPAVENFSKNTLLKIASNYYDSSMETLIMDNLTYLVDSISLKLSSNDLKPSLTRILLIILKISGKELIRNNLLSDLIDQLFILIDSYHGYGVLMEGFFMVFNEVINNIRQLYLLEKFIDIPSSLYRPWGMTTVEQLKDLLDESKKLIDPFEYDKDKEYFRKPDTPFSEIDGDSDDEEEEPEQDPEGDKDSEDKWDCVIPKDIYFQAQRVFIYGMKLLSHPSPSLKNYIINCLINVYPILTTNYPLLLPLISNWSEFEIVENSTIFELLTLMLEIDKFKNEMFLGKKFIDLFKTIETFNPKNLTTANKQLILDYLITGLNNYERIIPDTIAIKIMKLLMVLGIPENLGKQARNILWVLKHSDL